MAEVLMINPKRRTRRKTRRTAAQKAATRKLVARNRGRKRVTRRRRKNPSTRNAFGVPRYGTRRRNPVRRARRRNPARRSARGIVNTTLMPAVKGAAGALALDVAWGYLPIPMTLKTGYMRHVVKGVGALGLGYLANFVTSRSDADQMARGAMTVVVHGAMREAAQQFMPTVPLDGIGYYSAGMPVGAYVEGMGEYVGTGGATDPYLAADTLAKPFAGPSAATMARTSCLENESNMGGWYNE